MGHLEVEHRTPQWQDPECFEGHLNEKQLAALEQQDPKRELRTALMVSQLSQASDFCVGWLRVLVESVRAGETEVQNLRQTIVQLQEDVRTVKIKFQIAQWVAGIVGGAVLIETVRKWFH